MRDDAGLRADLDLRWQSLKEERSTWLPVWRQISEYIAPHLGRFTEAVDREDGRRNDTLIIDDSARIAHRNFCSGMQSGLTFPARPWFRLTTQGDPEMGDFPPIKIWLDHVRDVLLRIFAKSNAYSSFLATYAECGSFGVHAALVERDFDSVVRFRPFTAGEYAIGTDDRNRVDTFARSCGMSARMMVSAFGEKAVSESVRRAWDRGDVRSRFEVIHVVGPNTGRDVEKRNAANKPYYSVYYDPGDRADRVLRRSGYDSFPVIAPRWSTVSDQVYSKGSPGWFSLGNVKMIQQLQTDCLEGIQKVIDPPVQAPVALERYGLTAVPGGVNFVPDTGQGGIRSIYDVRPDIEAIEGKIQRVAVNIERAFFSDLFLMLTNMDQKGMTATEVAERHEEKLLMLGPVLEQLYAEMLDPVIDRTFELAMDAGIIPPPPPDLEGQEIKPEYVSVLAQAQRMVGISAIEQTMAFAGNLVGIFPEVRHKVDAIAAMQKYGTYVGVPAEILRTDEEAMERMAQEAEQHRQEQAMQAVPQMAGAGKTLSETDVGGNSALDAILGGLGGAP